MNLPYILLAILLLLYLVLRVRVGVEAGYMSRNLSLKLRLGLFRIRLLPPNKKKDHAKKRTQKQPKEKKPITRFLPYLPCAFRLVKRIVSRLRVDKLQANLIVATPDPADTVTRYGQLNAAIGALWGPFNNALEVKDANIHLDVDLQSANSSADAFLSVSWRLSQLLSALVLFLCDIIKSAHKKQKNKQKGMVVQYG